MQSKRDQVQAYFFVVSRLVSAVVTGKPDVLDSPYKRLNTGTVFGVLVAGILMAVFGIYGIFAPGGNDSWKQNGSIVMDESSGTRYAYLGGELRPVLNYASARLATGDASGGVVHSVSRKSLGDTPVGQAIGIVGAPDALPAADKLSSGPWTTCVQAAPSTSAGALPVVTVLLGQAPGRKVADGEALLVSLPDGQIHLVWQGRRHLVAGRDFLEALGYGDTRPMAVTAAWLNPIEQGPDISMPSTEGAGRPGPVIEGRPRTIGQVLRVRNPAVDSDQLYLLRQDGVVPLSRTAAALVLAAPGTRQAYPDGVVAPVDVGPVALRGIPVPDDVDYLNGLPPQPPKIVSAPRDNYACVRYELRAGGTDGETEFLPASVVDGSAVPVGEHEAGAVADRVAVLPGGGALVRNQPAPGAQGQALSLISENGVRYPIADADTLTALGFREDLAVPTPPSLLGLLPAGPVLSRAAALRTWSP
ncbi:type VII secretion protein EccB [Lentzea sp. NPDC059081]|uniref:type VII secretion protein EccB n=1 Tax=Lentzea sp. NPDC059081 TaxID=3346719 RepID=UPI0036CA24F5